jgi:microsomal dipeptidase-like Zn-dependent dipeptidase
VPIDSDLVAKLHRESPLTDIHAHPSLKAYLFRRNLWRHYRSGKTFNPFSSRSDFKMLKRGGVGVLWNALHLPERELFRCFWLRVAGLLVLPAYRKLVSGSPFERLLEMTRAMEREIVRPPGLAELATTAADVRRIRQLGKIAVVHTVEGTHVLEGDPRNLDRLASRGVAMVTLSHFFENGVAEQTRGIPRNNVLSLFCKYDFGWSHPTPLTDFGRSVLQHMSKLRMLVDVTHCTPGARTAVYGEMDTGRPVVASHVGVHQVHADPYNLRDDEIRHIASTGGLVGVIFMTHWLDPAEPKNGLDAIWRTIEHVHRVTGSFDHIGLGTDFDGFTDPPDDVRDASHMGRVTQLLLERGVAETDVRKILGGNAQRVLERGWR